MVCVRTTSTVRLLLLFIGVVAAATQTCEKEGSSTQSCEGEGATDKPSKVKSQVSKMADIQRTFIMVKPDGVHRGLVGEVIKRFETKGYRMVGMKMMQATEERLAEHYAEHEGKGFYEGLLQYIMSGPVVPMVWEGKGVISTGRAIIGATNPLVAPPGTIRGDYGVTVGRNIIHGSDAEESAKREIAIWFTDEELVQWEPCCTPWIYE